MVKATLEKSPTDTTATPAKIEENGVADLEGQIRVRLFKESNHRPEIFAFAEITSPLHKDKVLIGEQVWDLKPGIGIIRGFPWGTVTFRTTVENNKEAKHLDFGETSLEYLKRLSTSWRVYAAIEGGETGAPDEWDLRTGVSWRISGSAFLKVENAIGLFPKSTDWAPQIGIIFPLQTR